MLNIGGIGCSHTGTSLLGFIFQKNISKFTGKHSCIILDRTLNNIIRLIQKYISKTMLYLSKETLNVRDKDKRFDIFDTIKNRKTNVFC